ncbi:MAG: hypothetical protein AB7L94_31595 [Kofleriaceae bacterium]
MVGATTVGIQPPEAFSHTVYLKQMGTGTCAFGLFRSPPSDGEQLTAFIDGTYAGAHRSSVGPNGHNPWTSSWEICVRTSDGALVYHGEENAPWRFASTDAVLTRSAR